jgi:hypothetical protein
MEKETSNQTASLTEERANRLKAVEITIDSLKQYITLSTVAIAGLLAFFNGNGKYGTKWLFVTAVVGFILCSITSIFTINTFINKVHNHNIDARILGLRKLNFTAIAFFLIAVSACAAFFFSSQNALTNTNTDNSKIIIQEKSIDIGKDVKNKIIIKIDSLRKVRTILINQ